VDDALLGRSGGLVVELLVEGALGSLGRDEGFETLLKRLCNKVIGSVSSDSEGALLVSVASEVLVVGSGWKYTKRISRRIVFPSEGCGVGSSWSVGGALVLSPAGIFEVGVVSSLCRLRKSLVLWAERLGLIRGLCIEALGLLKFRSKKVTGCSLRVVRGAAGFVELDGFEGLESEPLVEVCTLKASSSDLTVASRFSGETLFLRGCGRLKMLVVGVFPLDLAVD
jgi:hypothetical protein